MYSKLSLWFKDSIIPNIIIIALLLALLFGYTLAVYMASPPSEGFSRETPLAQVSYGDSKIVKSHITTIKKNDNELTTLAVNGHELTIINNDVSGSITDNLSIPLDLFKAKQLSGYYKDTNTLVLFYIIDGLYSSELDLKTLEINTTYLQEDVKSFAHTGDQMILETSEGLVQYTTGSDGSNLLLSGDFITYNVAAQDNKSYIMYTKVNGFAYDLGILIANENSLENIVIAEQLRTQATEQIYDLYIKDNLLTGISINTNPRDGLNYINAIQYDLTKKVLLPYFEHGFLIHNSRFTLTDAIPGQYSIVLQLPYRGGVNLAEATVNLNGLVDIMPLTKTRGLTQLSDLVEMGNDRCLVFFDNIKDKRHLLFASTNEDLVATTTALTTIDPINIITVTFFASLMGLFVWSIPYLLLAGGAPTLLSILLAHFLGKKDRMKPELYDVIPAILMTVFKLYFTWHLIHRMGNYIVRPAIIGQEPFIYIALTLTSIIAYMLFIKSHKHAKGDAITVSVPFISYVGADLIMYSMLVFTYISLNMIVDKV